MSNIATTNTSMNDVTMMEYAYKFATIMSKSDIVPAHYRGKPENAFIAVQTALRMNLDPMLVMQNTYIVSGKLGMTSSFAISLANKSGIFDSGIRYRIEGSEDTLKVTAYANLKKNGEEISFTISMKEAQAEGWTSNKKYKTLPELMLRYRAATLLIRTHVPEVINGMHMVEEIEDVAMTRDITPKVQTLSAKLDELITEQEIAKDDIIEIEERNTEKLKELSELVLTHNISDELIGKWCNKAGVSALNELDDEQMHKCINYINNTNSQIQERV